MIFALLFSFIYGSGAIFILTWNASVISVAIGSAIREMIASAALGAGAVNIGTYFSAASIGVSRYLLHGIPEIGLQISRACRLTDVHENVVHDRK